MNIHLLGRKLTQQNNSTGRRFPGLDDFGEDIDGKWCLALAVWKH